ncbi:MAG: NAD(P)H-hydrate dehydratase, partial [Nitrospirota bacterium]
MLKVTTSEEMQQIDRTTIEKYGIPGAVLMERAGLRVVDRINELFFNSSAQGVRSKDSGRKVLIFCGGGNNGGDGFVIARELHNQGKAVEVFMTANPLVLKGDAKINYDSARKYGVPMRPVSHFLRRPSSRSAGRCLLVDALLGTGLSREVRAPLSNVISQINKISYPVVSVDIPSGISSDTGQIMGCAVRAQYTVTFGLPKRGHLLFPGADYTGSLFIEDIGFPQNLLSSDKIRINMVQKEDVNALLPARPKNSHKGTYGHVLIIAGSKGKTGAALMAARACLRTGAGLVTIGIPETLLDTFQSRVTEEMLLPLPDKGNGTLSLKSADRIFGFLGNKRGYVLAVGPGLSVDRDISKLVKALISESGVPMVIDADGLNAVADDTAVLKKSRAPVILTPHTGEMMRLLSKGAQGKNHGFGKDLKRTYMEQDRINIALGFARKTRTYLVLKGAPTVTATPEGTAYINSTGNPGMATAGSGDVLTGIISAFLAQGMSVSNASKLGVYAHGLAGDIAAGSRGQYSLIA